MPTRVKIKYFCGIDIGLSGAIVIQNSFDNNVVIHVTPTIKNAPDYAKMAEILSYYRGKDCHVVLENLHSIFGASAKSNFSFGSICGATEMALISNQIPYTRVQATDWQKLMFEGIKEVSKAKKTPTGKARRDTKAMSILACKRLFPKVSLIAPRCRTDHDGIADALLMSEYAKRKFA